MNDEREQEEQSERPRPRIVDKRVSARSGPSGSGAEATPPTDPATEPPDPGSAARAGSSSGPTTAGAAFDAGIPAEEAAAAGGPDPGTAAPGPGERVWTPEEEAQAQQMARELAERPSSDWVLNIAVTLANVAGAKIELGVAEDARLAIDTLEAIVNGVASRLEGAEAPLRQTLAQLQLAYAQTVQPPSAPPPQG